jgi:hypothetical protein
MSPEQCDLPTRVLRLLANWPPPPAADGLSAADVESRRRVDRWLVPFPQPHEVAAVRLRKALQFREDVARSNKKASCELLGFRLDAQLAELRLQTQQAASGVPKSWRIPEGHFLLRSGGFPIDAQALATFHCERAES